MRDTLKELRQANIERSLLRAVIDALPDYVYFKDREGKYVLVNKAHLNFLGRKNPEEVIGKTAFELFPKEMAKVYHEDDRRVLETGEPIFDREEKSIDAKGNVVWNSTTKLPLKNNDGEVIGLVGISRDITVRKEAEERLKDSEERYRILVENLPIGVYRTTPGPTGEYVMANQALLKVLGFDSLEELRKFRPSDLYMEPEEREKFSNMLLAKGKVEGLELYLRRKDGTPFWGLVNARVVYDKDGAGPYFDCTLIDITEEKKAKEALKQSEEKYRTLVQNVPVAVYRTTPGAKGRFVTANPMTLKIFGFDSEEELKGIDICDLYINPREREVFSRTLLTTGRVDGLELALKRKDGTVFWGQVTARLVWEKGGREPYFESTIIDITELKKAEEERNALIEKLKEDQRLLSRQNKELDSSRRAMEILVEELKESKRSLEERTRQLEEVNQELDDFTYTISHDLKEPLRSIDAFAKFIYEESAARLSQEAKKYLERIRANTTRMQNLIEDLLEISRIERRAYPWEFVQVEDMIQEVKERLEFRIREKNAQVVIKGKLPRVFCDRVRLTEVFLNLIANGIKFNDKPKPVVEVGCNTIGDHYEFYVRDNGIGIEKQYFDRIFKIFERLGRREQDEEGTGAGLAIVKKIVEKHQGKVWVESKVGEGSTFYFTIPKEPKKEGLGQEKGEVPGTKLS